MLHVKSVSFHFPLTGLLLSKCSCWTPCKAWTCELLKLLKILEVLHQWLGFFRQNAVNSQWPPVKKACQSGRVKPFILLYNIKCLIHDGWSSSYTYIPLDQHSDSLKGTKLVGITYRIFGTFVSSTKASKTSPALNYINVFSSWAQIDSKTAVIFLWKRHQETFQSTNVVEENSGQKKTDLSPNFSGDIFGANLIPNICRSLAISCHPFLFCCCSLNQCHVQGIVQEIVRPLWWRYKEVKEGSCAKTRAQ